MIDPTLTDSFRTEVREALEELTGLVLASERSGQITDKNRALFLRRFHGLKGAAVLVGDTATARLLHSMESLLQQRIELVTFDGRFFDALLDAFDLLMRRVAPTGQPVDHDDPEVDTLVSRIGELLIDPVRAVRVNFERLYPSLQESHRDVLTEQQEQRLVDLGTRGSPVLVVDVLFSVERFNDESNRCHDLIETMGEIVSCASQGLESDSKVRFTYLVATERSGSDLIPLLSAFSPRIGNPRKEPAHREIDQTGVSTAEPALVADTSVRAPQAMPMVAPSVDESMAEEILKACRAEYLGELPEQIDEIGTLFDQLRREPGKPKPLDALFRFCHTLKGTAGTLKYATLTQLGSEMEDLLSAIRAGRVMVGDAVLDLFHEWLGVLEKVGRELKTGVHDEGTPPAILEKLKTAASGYLEAMKKPDHRTAGPMTAGIESTVESTVEGVTEAVPADRRTVASGLTAFSREASETIRVGLSKVDAIINTAGELVNRKSGLQLLEKELRAFMEGVQQSFAVLEQIREQLELCGTSTGSSDALRQHLALLGRSMNELGNRSQTAFVTGEALHTEISGLVDRLGEESIRIRMIPLRHLFQRYPRMVRDIARSLGKDVEFEYSGEETEIDKVVLERLEDPILHMVRNAIDHGIEPPAARRLAGKPPRGRIHVGAGYLHGRVVIELSDDGSGMSVERIGAKAITAGLVTEERLKEMAAAEVLEFIFAPGFSTREIVTEVSGRGVGMDVVRTNIGRLQGQVEIRTEPGRGTKFTLSLPLTLSIIQSVMVLDAGTRYCLPATSVLEVLKVSRDALTDVGGRKVMSFRGGVVPVTSLSDLFGTAPFEASTDVIKLIVIGNVQKRMGLAVDEIEAEEEIVIKPLGSILRAVENVSGVTIRPRGDLAVVLDCDGLLRSLGRRSRSLGFAPPERPSPSEPSKKGFGERSRVRVLVAEDSTTSREMLTSILEIAGYQVTAVANGRDAWERLGSTGADLVVTDLDMPLVGGLELTRRIRSSPALVSLPVILVTSLGADDEKARGLEVGANAYIAKKSFEQDAFLARVRELTGGSERGGSR